METNTFDISNVRFIDELFAAWKQNAESVPDEWKRYFVALENGTIAGGAPAAGAPGREATANGAATNGATANGAANHAFPSNGSPGHTANGAAGAPPVASAGHAVPRATETGDPRYAVKQAQVDRLIWSFRDVGYIYADTNPLSGYTTPEMEYQRYAIEEGNYERLQLSDFGLGEDDMDTVFYCGPYLSPSRAPLREILRMLRETYCAGMGVEILHIQTRPMRRWLIEKVETSRRRVAWTKDQKVRFAKDVIKAEEFESFVQTNFIGQKRFSLEGGEVLIPALRYLITSSSRQGVQEIVLGMAHRGRLNVFTNALRKPGVETFAKFEDNYKPHTYGGSGDVKYHLGHSFDYKDGDGNRMHISLVANPSHLEAVDPVVEGKARGIQRRRKDRNRKKVIPVLIHGDAAFSGQGIVAETFNLSQLKGYKTGGTVHIICNNQIGFTTASRDARSTFFATDMAKSMPVPIFHVNGDQPETVVRAIDLALKFRQKFGYDAVVDIICYRRLGHNEADEPSFTHPIMYNLISKHPSVAKLYGEELAKQGVYPAADQDAFREKYRNVLLEELQKAKEGQKPNVDDAFEQGEWRDFRREYSFEPVPTGVARDRLDHIAKVLTDVPADFQVHPKLKRLVTMRRQQFEGATIDWAFGEALAFGSLLMEGYPIRLSGEDSARGTFSQRHAVWWDVESSVPRTHTALRHLAPDQGAFSVYDSPLSEYSVLGFDYGYSIAQPNVLVLWEAQFGDFVNGAQVLIDNFISSGEMKWFRSSGLVMLLPHGFEGQGPEHSSAHLERFLMLCAEDNWQVVNPSTPAQYFHMLRRQMKQPFRKPLIVMTPKSLLRHKLCVSSVEEMTGGHFNLVIDDPKNPTDAEVVLLCSGKVYYDLYEEREKRDDRNVAIIRVEQLYPFPREELSRVVGRYRRANVVNWVQEEPRNRGAWGFVRGRLMEHLGLNDVYYCGRSASASPATGSYREHLEQMTEFMNQAFSHERRPNRERLDE